MLYQQDAPGDCGQMRGSPNIAVATEELSTTDGYKHFLRSWNTGSSEILLILHGLGAHSGWFIDMGNSLASADTFWRRKETASFLFQIFLMRSAFLDNAKNITIPALVIQVEADKSVVPAATQKLYETLVSKDKTWKALPNYKHDSEFERDRSLLDDTVAAWIREHAAIASMATS